MLVRLEMGCVNALTGVFRMGSSGMTFLALTIAVIRFCTKTDSGQPYGTDCPAHSFAPVSIHVYFPFYDFI